MTVKKEPQTTSLQLTKSSESEQVKNYFTKIFELKKSGKDFPINLEDVFPLVYERKEAAVKVLKSDFVENEDYILLRQNDEQKKRGGHNKVDYMLSVGCLEYFIAKKIKPVFEVYRKVFHRVVENGESNKTLSDKAGKTTEGSVYITSMGTVTNHVFVENDLIWAKITPIAKLYGYFSRITYMHNRIGDENIKKNFVGKTESYFMNLDGFINFTKNTRNEISSKELNGILQMYGANVELPEANVFAYTYEEMLDILAELTKSPVNKNKVQSMLHNGRKR